MVRARHHPSQVQRPVLCHWARQDQIRLDLGFRACSTGKGLGRLFEGLIDDQLLSYNKILSEVWLTQPQNNLRTNLYLFRESLATSS